MGKFSDELTKFGYFLLVSLLVVCFLFPFMYLGTYKLINNIDSSIYARYATNEKFEENIFFNATVEEKTGIIKQLESEINDLIEFSRIQEFAYVIIQNQNKVEDIVSNNADYQTYLISIGSSVDDLIDWSEKTAALDDKISMGCLYLTFLLISIVMVVLFGFRKTFYVCAGITYTVAMLSMFTDGISDYLVANVLSLLAKLSSDVFTYRDMTQWNLIFNQAFKESTLTFIIFDTVVQICQNNKKEQFEKSCRYIYSSIDIQCSYLEQYQNLSNTYIAKMIMPIDSVIKHCRKNANKVQKKMKNKRLSDANIKALNIEHGYYNQLEKLLLFLQFNNSEEHTTKEYISYLRETQWLMYKCNIAIK